MEIVECLEAEIRWFRGEEFSLLHHPQIIH